MKIIRQDGDNTSSYIQLKDLEALMLLGVAVPREVMSAMLEHRYDMSFLDKDEFIEFGEKQTGWFLKGPDCEFIPDLDENYNLSEDAFATRCFLTRQSLSGLGKLRDDGRNEININNEEVLRQVYVLTYKLSSLKDIWKIRKGTSTLELPVELKKEPPKTYRKYFNDPHI